MVFFLTSAVIALYLFGRLNLIVQTPFSFLMIISSKTGSCLIVECSEGTSFGPKSI